MTGVREAIASHACRESQGFTRAVLMVEEDFVPLLSLGAQR